MEQCIVHAHPNCGVFLFITHASIDSIQTCNLQAINASIASSMNMTSYQIEITRYRHTRFWAIWLDGELLAVTVYKKGATAISQILQPTSSTTGGNTDESISNGNDDLYLYSLPNNR